MFWLIIIGDASVKNFILVASTIVDATTTLCNILIRSRFFPMVVIFDFELASLLFNSLICFLRLDNWLYHIEHNSV